MRKAIVMKILNKINWDLTSKVFIPIAIFFIGTAIFQIEKENARLSVQAQQLANNWTLRSL
jgi:hypothetical protein